MSRGPVNRASLRTSVQRQQPRERGIIGLSAFMELWYVRGHQAQKAFSATGRRRSRARYDERGTAREMIVQFPGEKDGPVTDTEPLLLTRDGAVATLTINRPDRLNTLTYAMFARLPQVLADAAGQPGLRALVLRGAGARAFSAGADISEFGTTRTTREQATAYDEAVLAAEEAVAAFPLPTIAAVHGHCYGGGCGLAVACDLRFAAAGARFAITPAKLGIVYPLRGTKRLVDLVGPSRAKIILMSGADYSAAQAQSFGLADEVFADPPALDAGVREFTALLASRSGVSQRGAKQTIARILDGVTHDDAAHAELRAAAFASPDYAEGVRAFLDRRPPVFG